MNAADDAWSSDVSVTYVSRGREVVGALLRTADNLETALAGLRTLGRTATGLRTRLQQAERDLSAAQSALEWLERLIRRPDTSREVPAADLLSMHSQEIANRESATRRINEIEHEWRCACTASTRIVAAAADALSVESTPRPRDPLFQPWVYAGVVRAGESFLDFASSYETRRFAAASELWRMWSQTEPVAGSVRKNVEILYPKVRHHLIRGARLSRQAIRERSSSLLRINVGFGRTLPAAASRGITRIAARMPVIGTALSFYGLASAVSSASANGASGLDLLREEQVQIQGVYAVATVMLAFPGTAPIGAVLVATTMVYEHRDTLVSGARNALRWASARLRG
jgi:hypothetical protein